MHGISTVQGCHLVSQRLGERRLSFYESRDQAELRLNDADTASLQKDLWSAVVEATATQRDPVSAIVAAGMNDVLNSQGYTQAAWWNRIPPGAWLLMWLIAIACHLLVGHSERRMSRITLLVLPAIVAVAFFLISDIDSPREGIILVKPQNLIALYQSLKAH
jgi:hypothetical protein